VELTGLLYLAPPMYHMNLDEFAKHRQTMKRYYEFFSPLHREFGFSQMTEFNWLSSDRLLQRTVLDGAVELIANFSHETRRYGKLSIPGRSVVASWKDRAQTRTYSVAQQK
ncbi:MAG: glycoside hydrolase, partial [Planctomycetota bacterium]